MIGVTVVAEVNVTVVEMIVVMVFATGVAVTAEVTVAWTAVEV